MPRLESTRIDDPDRRDEIEEILENTDHATVTDRSQRTWQDDPPVPLDLQYAQRRFPGSPSQVLSNLQDLYNAGHTTYPRTSNTQYGDLDVSTRLQAIRTGTDVPVPDHVTAGRTTSGDEHDPAHPPIVPTENTPDDLGKWTGIVYERVCRHLVATCMGSATKQKTTYTLDVGGISFELELYDITEFGYFEVYGKYKRVYDDTDPDWDPGSEIEITDWEIDERETDPPDPWTESSVIDKMEGEGLGTSATRASMIDKIQDRGYVSGDDGLETTVFGEQIVSALEKHAPRITDPTLTADLQSGLDEIRRGDATADEIIERSRDWVSEATQQVLDHRSDIADDLRVLEDACPECGGDMWLRSGYNLFYGCENYPNCEGTKG